MRLEAETTLTKPLMRKYLHWMLIENQKKRLAVVQLFGAVLAMLSFLMIWQLPYDAAGYVGLLLAVAVVVGFNTMPRWSAALRFRGQKAADAGRQHFLFLDDALVAEEPIGDIRTGRVTVRYDQLLKAVDDKDAFYLFIKKDSAYIVGKADFSVGDPKELSERLAKLPGKRYVQVK